MFCFLPWQSVSVNIDGGEEVSPENPPPICGLSQGLTVSPLLFTIYMKLLSEAIYWNEFDTQLYIQLYISKSTLPSVV